MPAATYNITVDQGSDFLLPMVLKDNGIPRNLTGYSARAQMRVRHATAAIKATFTCVVDDPSNGSLYMALDNATSTAVTSGTYWYDLEIYTAADADVQRLLKGTVKVDPEVTR